jgi:hypothetical protein
MNTTKRFSILLGLLLIISPFSILNAQKPNAHLLDTGGIRVMFYNCENFFDTIDDPKKDDAEYLPSSQKKWNTEKYLKKVDHLARVVYSVDSVHLPVFAGFTEIEDGNVLKDLVKTSWLKKGKYKCVHLETSDPRGVDPALIYRPDVMKVADAHLISVFYDSKSDKSTREILYVKGIIGKDTLHIFVNHWKSRIGGIKETDPKRMAYAKTLRANVDNILAAHHDAKIMIMGDFNDSPLDESVHYGLGAITADTVITDDKLYNLMYEKAKNGEGSHKYDGWEMLDQMIVSGSALSSNAQGIRFDSQKTAVFQMPFMMYKTKEGLFEPSRTYSGTRYYGGYSDHLPVYTTMYFRK